MVSIILLSMILILAGLVIIFTVYLDKTWVEIDVTQCANPWDKYSYDQIQKNKEFYKSLSYDQWETERDKIIQNYFEDQDIIILDMKYGKRQHEATLCEACSCAGGGALLLLIPNSEINKMLEFGFIISKQG